jgi:putative tryptophan/tyrosine transport system substrate-binding protein
MNKKPFATILMTFTAAAAFSIHAQPYRPYRVGVIHLGGPYTMAVDGLKDGLGALGLVVGKDVLLEVHDVQGDRAAIGNVAKSLEQAKIDVLFTLSTSATVAAKSATSAVPIVFAIGGDAVGDGLVASLARPGGRLTGVQRLSRLYGEALGNP